MTLTEDESRREEQNSQSSRWVSRRWRWSAQGPASQSAVVITDAGLRRMKVEYVPGLMTEEQRGDVQCVEIRLTFSVNQRGRMHRLATETLTFTLERGSEGAHLLIENPLLERGVSLRDVVVDVEGRAVLSVSVG